MISARTRRSSSPQLRSSGPESGGSGVARHRLGGAGWLFPSATAPERAPPLRVGSPVLVVIICESRPVSPRDVELRTAGELPESRLNLIAKPQRAVRTRVVGICAPRVMPSLRIENHPTLVASLARVGSDCEIHSIVGDRHHLDLPCARRNVLGNHPKVFPRNQRQDSYPSILSAKYSECCGVSAVGRVMFHHVGFNASSGGVCPRRLIQPTFWCASCVCRARNATRLRTA